MTAVPPASRLRLAGSSARARDNITMAVVMRMTSAKTCVSVEARAATVLTELPTDDEYPRDHKQRGPHDEAVEHQPSPGTETRQLGQQCQGRHSADRIQQQHGVGGRWMVGMIEFRAHVINSPDELTDRPAQQGQPAVPANRTCCARPRSEPPWPRTRPRTRRTPPRRVGRPAAPRWRRGRTAAPPHQQRCDEHRRGAVHAPPRASRRARAGRGDATDCPSPVS